jgi:hypothetical protein
VEERGEKIRSGTACRKGLGKSKILREGRRYCFRVVWGYLMVQLEVRRYLTLQFDRGRYLCRRFKFISEILTEFVILSSSARNRIGPVKRSSFGGQVLRNKLGQGRAEFPVELLVVAPQTSDSSLASLLITCLRRVVTC